MAYGVVFKPSARRELLALPKAIQKRIDARLLHLVTNPRAPGAEKLAGAANLYRVRVGDYRILYAIRDQDSTVIVLKVGHRRDVYRRL